jgi:hypothetical protein
VASLRCGSEAVSSFAAPIQYRNVGFNKRRVVGRQTALAEQFRGALGDA